jgi:putative ABC transport system ATP-binding protein
MSTIISAHQLTKTYGKGKDAFCALGPLDFTIEKGSFTVIIGKSGSGKSTLLNLLAGLDSITSGRLNIQNTALEKTSSKKLSQYRKKIGIIFQFYNLLPNLTAYENIAISAQVRGIHTSKPDIETLLDQFGLSHRAKSPIPVLSGGEKQRVAICRALIAKPEILFCDEPTGALDSTNEGMVRDILQDLHKKGMTIIMVTHNDEFTKLADTVFEMHDGHIIHNKTK